MATTATNSGPVSLNDSIADNKKYVYDGTECDLTGRSAIRTVRPNVTDRLVEIKPSNQDGPQWKKWVKPTDLYQIIETRSEIQNE